MPVLPGNRGTRRVLLVTVTAAILAAGGAGVAYASSHGPAVESGYAVVSTESELPSQTLTKRDCEQWRDQQQGEQPTPGDSATSELTGRL